MKSRTIQLKKAIAGIEHNYPPDDLLKSYKDFTRERELLPYYQYNQKVFESLVNIALDVWKGNERVNRASLIEFIKRYGNKNPDKKNLSAKTSSQLFELFRIVLTEGNPGISKNTFKEMKGQVNMILKDVKLKEEELQWMIDNLEKSEHFINRILRQPGKSKVVSQWAALNFYNFRYIERRAELIGRMLDEDAEFEVTQKLIIQDFENSLAKDVLALNGFNDELEAGEVLENQLRDVLPSFKLPRLLSDKNSEPYDVPFMSSRPDLKLTKRFYPTPMLPEDDHDNKIPDFEKLRQQFYDNLDLTWRVSIGWGIAYSHLDNKEKCRLLQKHYSENVYLYYFRIGKQFKIMEFLNWLLEKYR
ncbi:MAG: hypothetical protein POELPBGB_02260 [Bacteroidia bacterium]|nr:hypothetical protein [Bacteroidia bacterium]